MKTHDQSEELFQIQILVLINSYRLGVSNFVSHGHAFNLRHAKTLDDFIFRTQTTNPYHVLIIDTEMFNLDSRTEKAIVKFTGKTMAINNKEYSISRLNAMGIRKILPSLPSESGIAEFCLNAIKRKPTLSMAMTPDAAIERVADKIQKIMSKSVDVAQHNEKMSKQISSVENESKKIQNAVSNMQKTVNELVTTVEDLSFDVESLKSKVEALGQKLDTFIGKFSIKNIFTALASIGAGSAGIIYLFKLFATLIKHAPK